MVRGILVSEIYKKTVETSLPSSAGKAAVTLMSTDVERVVNGLRGVNEAWASFITVSFAAWLLFMQLNVAFLGPVALCAGIIPPL
jgi:ATP-binding cassette subfamily C (CFTR/MRP) protein 1